MDLNQLLFGAFGTDDVVSIGNETASNQRCFAAGANEAIIVPVSVLEGDESSASEPGNWLSASSASLGKQLSEAVSTIWLVVTAGEALSGQRSRAIGASKTLTMPRLVFVCHSTRSNNLVALDAASGILLLVAAGAVDLLLARYKRLGADRCLADATAEALLVPLACLVLHFLRSSSENFAATIAS